MKQPEKTGSSPHMYTTTPNTTESYGKSTEKGNLGKP